MYICTLDSQPQVIKFTSCLHMVGGSLRLLPPLKLVAMIYEILLKVALITINQSTNHICNVYFFVQLIYYNGCLFFVCIFDFFAGGILFLFWSFCFFFLFLFLSYIIAIRNNFICALKLLIFIFLSLLLNVHKYLPLAIILKQQTVKHLWSSPFYHVKPNCVYVCKPVCTDTWWYWPKLDVRLLDGERYKKVTSYFLPCPIWLLYQ